MDIGAEAGGVGWQDPWDMGLEHRRCQNITVKILAMDDIRSQTCPPLLKAESQWAKTLRIVEYGELRLLTWFIAGSC
jgi:hypothetical protein